MSHVNKIRGIKVVLCRKPFDRNTIGWRNFTVFQEHSVQLSLARHSIGKGQKDWLETVLHVTHKTTSLLLACPEWEYLLWHLCGEIISVHEVYSNNTFTEAITTVLSGQPKSYLAIKLYLTSSLVTLLRPKVEFACSLSH